MAGDLGRRAGKHRSVKGQWRGSMERVDSGTYRDRERVDGECWSELERRECQGVKKLFARSQDVNGAQAFGKRIRSWPLARKAARPSFNSTY
jgi:hypothetical protein